MVGVITGPGLLGSESFQHGIGSEKSSNGQTLGGDSYVNLSNGRLILQYVDESLSGSSGDLNYIRYTGGDAITDADGDGWSDGVRRVDSSLNLSTNPSLGSSFTWYMRDGSAVEAVWNGSIYVIEDGAGAHDTVEYDAANNRLIWTNGDSGFKEYVSFGDSPYTKGRILSSRDTEGNGRDYAYSQISTGAFRLTQITDVGNNQKLVLEYDNYGRLEYLKSNRYSSASSEVIETQYIYNSSTDNRLKEVRSFLEQADGTGAYYSTQYEYYEYTNGLGNLITTNLVDKVTQSDGSEIDIDYENYNNNGSTDYRVTSVTDRWGTTGFLYANNQVQITKGDGSTVTHTFENNGRRHTISKGYVSNGYWDTAYEQKKIFNYDAEGNLVEIEDGKQNLVKRDYDDNGNLTHEWVQTGTSNYSLTIWRYSSDNLLQSKTVYKDSMPYAGVVNYEPPSGEVGSTSYYVYDNARNLRYSISAEGRVARTDYVNISSGRGRIHKSINYVKARYNVSNLTRTTVLTESQLDSWASGLNPADKQAIELTQYTYNNLDQLTTTKQYGNTTTGYSGASDDQMVEKHFVYSVYGQLLETYTKSRYGTANVVQESYTYDGLGRVKTSTKAGVAKSYVYDLSNVGPYGWGAGAVQSTDSATGLTTTEVFDNRGRVLYASSSADSAPSVLRSVFYEYDDAGRVFKTSQTIDGSQGDTTYTYYNEGGQVSFEISASGGVTEYKYNENGMIKDKIEYFQGLTESELSGLTKDSDPNAIMTYRTHEKDLRTEYIYHNNRSVYQKVKHFDGQWTRQTFLNFDYSNATNLSMTHTNVGSEPTRFVSNHYDKDGLLVGQLNEDFFFTEFVYDGAGRLVKNIRYEQNAESQLLGTFDEIKALADTDVNGDGDSRMTTYFYYDAQGRQVGTVNEQGFFTETEYLTSRFRKVQHQYHDVLDFIPNLDLETASFNDIKNAMEGRARYTTTETYDRYGRLYSTAQPSGLTTQYLYDDAGRLSKTVEHVTTTTSPELEDLSLPFEQNGLWDFTEGGWRLNSGATVSNYTGPSNGFGTYAYIEATQTEGGLFYSGQEALLESQSFYAAANSELTFKYHMYGDHIGTLSVEVFHDGQWKAVEITTNGQTLPNLSGEQQTSSGQAWRDATVDLGQYTGNVKIRFKSATDDSNPGYQNDMAVDEVVITNAARLGQRVTHTQYNAFGEVTGTVSGEGAQPIVLVEGFESQAAPTSAAGNGWATSSTKASGSASSNSFWRIEKDKTGSAVTGPEGGGSAGSENFAYFETSGGYANAAGDFGTLESPAFTAQGGRLEFDYHMFGNNIGQLEVEVLHDGSWQQLWSAEGQQHSSGSDPWTHQVIDLSEYKGASIKVRFKATATNTGTSYYGDIAIDNVSVVETKPSWDISQSETVDEVQQNIDAFGVRYEYDSMGRQLVRYGAEGQRTWYFYDRENRLTHTVNGEGEVSETVYNARGQIESTRRYSQALSDSILEQALSNRTASNSQIANSLSASSTDEVETFDYDARGLLISSTDAEGNQVVNEYNGFGDVISTTRQNVSDENNPRVDMVNTFRRDTLGRAFESFTLKEDGTSVLTNSQAFDAYGRIIRSTDGLGQDTTYDYGWNGRLVETFDNADNRVGYSYKDSFNYTMTIDGEGHYTHHYHSADGSTRIERPDGSTIVTKRNEDGQVLEITDGRGNTTRQEYDLNGNLIKSFDALDPENQVLAHSYDASGRTVSTTDALGNTTIYTYDAANRVVKERVDPDGLDIETRFTYDNLGRLESKKTRNDDGSDRIENYEYYDNGQLYRTIKDPDGLQLTTTYEYDSLGNTTKVARGDEADPNQSVTEYEYDDWGRKSKEIIDPEGLELTTEYFYDNAGNLTRVIDANGNSSWNIYNELNQLRYAVDQEKHVTEYFYDLNGQVVATRALSGDRNVNVSVNGQGKTSISGDLTDYLSDKWTIKVLDNMGREAYTLTQTTRMNPLDMSSQWAVTQNVFDGNGNIVTTLRYGELLVGEPNSVRGLSIQDLVNDGYSHSGSDDARATQLVFDANNRLRYTVNAENYISENIYDTVGNVVEKRQYENAYTGTNFEEAALYHFNKGQSRATHYVYDNANRLIEERVSYQAVLGSGIGSLDDGNTVVEFNDLGNHSTVTKRKVFTYNSLGQVIATYDHYESAGNSRDLPESTGIEYRYDAAGRQTHTIKSLWYDTVTHQFSATAPAPGSVQEQRSFQHTTIVDYDAVGNAIRERVTAGKTNGQLEYSHQYKAYDKSGRIAYEIDKSGAIKQHVYDDGELRYTHQWAGSSSNPPNISNVGIPGNEFWELGEIEYEVAMRESANYQKRTLEFQYDNMGRKTHVRQLFLNGEQLFSPNSSASHQLDSSSSASGFYNGTFSETIFTYDAFGQVTSETSKINEAEVARTRYYYNKVGQVVATQDAEGYVTKATYNGYGDESYRIEYANKQSSINMDFWTTSTKDRVVKMEYDAMGRMTASWQLGSINATDAALMGDTARNLDVTYYSRDGNGNLQTHNPASHHVDEISYNAFGEMDHVINHHAGTDQNFEYNSMGQLVSVVENNAGDFASDNKLDPFKNQLENGHRVTYTLYNAMGKVAAEVYSVDGAKNGLSITQYAYDVAGNLTGVWVPTEITSGTINKNTGVQDLDIDLSYINEDAWGMSHISGGNDRMFEYDVEGRVLFERLFAQGRNGAGGEMYSHTKVTEYHYDEMGRLIADLQHSQASSFNQNDFDELDVNAKKAGTRSYYNAFGELQETRAVWGASSDSLESLDYAVLERYSYDSVGQLAEKEGADGITTYFYDYQGNVTRQEQRSRDPQDGNTVRVTENVYDKLGRTLIQRTPTFAGVDTDTSGSISYFTNTLYPVVEQSYDRWGNVLTVTQPFDARDSSSSTKQKQTVTHLYDFANRVIKIENPESLVFDASNPNGVSKRREDYIRYDLQGNKLQERDGDGVRVRNWSYDEAKKLEKYTDATGVWTEYAYDGLGNQVGRMQVNGVVFMDEFDRSGNMLTRGILHNAIVNDLYTSYKHFASSQDAIEYFHISDYEYDNLGRRTREINYAEQGTRPSQTYPSIHYQHLYYYYNEFDHVTERRNNQLRQIYAYDEFGNKIREYEYGGFGLSSTNFIQGHTESWDYGRTGLGSESQPTNSNFGRIATYRGKEGHDQYAGTALGQFKDTEYVYNGFGELKSEQFSGITTTYNYNDAGAISNKRKVKETGNEYTDGQMWQVIDPNKPHTNSVNYRYDEIAVTHFYDVQGRIVKEQDTQHYIKQLMFNTISTGNGMASSDYVKEADVTGATTKYYSYDNSGYLKNTWSTGGTYRNGIYSAGSSSTSSFISFVNGNAGKFNELSYGYDIHGNRSKVKMRYTYAGNANEESPIEQWNTFDAEGRQLIVDGKLVGNTVQANNRETSHILSYDNMGRKEYDTSFKEQKMTFSSGGRHPIAMGIVNKFETRKYTYNDYGILALEERITDLESNGTSSVLTSGTFKKYRAYNIDLTGKLHREDRFDNNGNYSSHLQNRYAIEGILIQSQEYDGDTTISAQHFDYNNEINGYDVFGRLTGQYRVQYGNTEFDRILYTDYYEFRNNQYVKVRSTSREAQSGDGNTNLNYDRFGRLTSKVINGKTQYFFYNFDGQVVKTAPSSSSGVGDNTDTIYFQGNPLATFSSTNDELNRIETGYVPLAENVARSGVSSYVATSDSSLASIAAAVYGDSSFWYLIAEANGLSMGPSDNFSGSWVGYSLTIPNIDTAVHNNSQTFKPYNSAELIGNTTPPTIPPSPKCSPVMTIMIVAIAIVVTIYTAGAAAGAMGASITTTAAGGAAVTTSAAAAGAWTAGAAVLTGGFAAGSVGLGLTAAFIGGVAGSLASQAFAKSMGVIDEIDLRQAAASGLTSAASAGIGYLAKTGQAINAGKEVGQVSKTVRAIAKFVDGAGSLGQGALRGTAAYHSAKLTGTLQPGTESWKMIAASAVSAPIGDAAGAMLPKGMPDLFKNTISGFAASAVSANIMRRPGEDINYGLLAADAFGNAIGSTIKSELLSQPGSSRPVTSGSSKDPKAGTGGTTKSDGSVDQTEVQKSLVSDTVTEAVGEVKDSTGAEQKQEVKFELDKEALAKEYARTLREETKLDLDLDLDEPEILFLGSAQLAPESSPSIRNVNRGPVVVPNYPGDAPNDPMGRGSPSLLKSLLGKGRWAGWGLLFATSSNKLDEFGYDGTIWYRDPSQTYFNVASEHGYLNPYHYEPVDHPGGAMGSIWDGSVVVATVDDDFNVYETDHIDRAGYSDWLANGGEGTIQDWQSMGRPGLEVGGANKIPLTGRNIWADSSQIRWSQESVSFKKSANAHRIEYNLDDLAKQYKTNPDAIPAVDVVRMPDGKLTALDNSRLTVRADMGGDIKVNIFNYDDALPDPKFAARFKSEGVSPDTYGQAVINRINSQKAAFSEAYPYGSPVAPKVTGTTSDSYWSKYSLFPWLR